MVLAPILIIPNKIKPRTLIDQKKKKKKKKKK